MILHFLDSGQGNLINISSIQGIQAPKFEHYEGTNLSSPIEYSAIKSGVISITKYLAKLYKKRNIRVNCISPGGILDGQPESFLRNYEESCNSKGMLDSKDLVGSLMFLLSDQSQFMTGQNIVIDDGWSL
jgi:NAD(P)-dependent dehydrogenase (short-subunit alcohol dehydrogenase family)